MESHQLLRLPIKIRHNEYRALIDSGANENYINTNLVHALNLPTIPLPDKTVVLADGRHQDGSKAMPALTFRIGQFKDKRSFLVTQLAHYDLILGKPWFTIFNPTIDWLNNIVTIHHKGHTHVLHANYMHVHDDESCLSMLSAT